MPRTATCHHAGPRPDTFATGRIVGDRERRVFRLRQRDAFDRLVAAREIDHDLAVVGRLWCKLYRAGRLLADVPARDLTMPGGGGDDDHDRANAELRRVLHALDRRHHAAAATLAEDKPVPAAAVALRAIDEAMARAARTEQEFVGLKKGCK